MERRAITPATTATAAGALVAVVLLCAMPVPAGAAMERTVVFMPFWAQYRPPGCEWQPRNFSAKLATHANFAFVFLNPDLTPKILDWQDETLFGQMRALMKQNPALKIMVSIGGSGMMEPGSGYEQLFSWAVANKANRSRMIKGAMEFCKKYQFDGVDIDWEAPGGRPTDKAGLVALFKEWRAAIKASKRPFLLSLDGPQFCSATEEMAGCTGFDLSKLHPYVDFISIMSYFYHSPDWDDTTFFHTPWVGDAQYTWGVKRTLDYYIRTAKVPPAKINVGLGLFGTVYRLASKNSTGLHAPSAGAGPQGGACTPSEPIGWRDMRDLYDRGARLVEDLGPPKAAYMVQGDLWYALDTPRTVVAKLLAAKKMGVGGSMIWESSYDDEQQTMHKAIRSLKAQPMRRRPPKPEPLCGNGYVGNIKRCADPKQCCSTAGWCWYDDDHCKGANCLGGPCYD